MRARLTSNNNQFGLTLIEVLVALMITGIAMTAVIKAVSQSLVAQQQLQSKIIANWLATDIIRQVQLNLLKIPFAPGNLQSKTDMLNRTWYWQASLKRTPQIKINRILVKVAAAENAQPILSLVGYQYVIPKK